VRSRTPPLILLAAFVIAGCDPYPAFEVVNGAGRPVAIGFEGSRQGLRRVPPGQRLRAPAGVVAYDRLVVAADGCRLTYPSTDRGIDFSIGGFTSLQLGVDLRLYIRPDRPSVPPPPFKGRTLSPARALAAAQPEGWPLVPVKKVCGQASAEAAGFAAPVRAASARL